MGNVAARRTKNANDAKKDLERLFLDSLLAHLQWDPDEIRGGETPDFVVRCDGRRVAVEVTRIYGRELRNGSPEAQWERDLIRFVNDLRAAYEAGSAHQLMDVTVAFPLPIRSSAVRQLTPGEHRADRADVMRRALARLRYLPRLTPIQRHKFVVRQRDGRPVTFYLIGLPKGAEHLKRWKPNITLGWVAIITPGALQAKVAAKARDLPKYRSKVDAAYLLVVADARRASGYLELPPGMVVDTLGFDAVYFQRHPELTHAIARAPRGA